MLASQENWRLQCQKGFLFLFFLHCAWPGSGDQGGRPSSMPSMTNMHVCSESAEASHCRSFHACLVLHAGQLDEGGMRAMKAMREGGACLHEAQHLQVKAALWACAQETGAVCALHTHRAPSFMLCVCLTQKTGPGGIFSQDIWPSCLMPPMPGQHMLRCTCCASGWQCGLRTEHSCACNCRTYGVA